MNALEEMFYDSSYSYYPSDLVTGDVLIFCNGNVLEEHTISKVEFNPNSFPSLGGVYYIDFEDGSDFVVVPKDSKITVKRIVE
jgi:hypothetical protein